MFGLELRGEPRQVVAPREILDMSIFIFKYTLDPLCGYRLYIYIYIIFKYTLDPLCGYRLYIYILFCFYTHISIISTLVVVGRSQNALALGEALDTVTFFSRSFTKFFRTLLCLVTGLDGHLRTAGWRDEVAESLSHFRRIYKY